MSRTLTKAGRYQIIGELGRGSMGVVYKGFDPVIGRTVAIKTMLVEALPSAEFEEYKARFQREAQAAGILTHPNIVTVYDFGEDEGVLFLAMEFLEGESLKDLVEKQGVLPVETVIPMYEQVCSALDAAHANKIVHRDVKPANIMILESGLVKMTDFGIAKVMHTGMTQAGQILGTPNYMSPEQVKGRSVDGRSDIFSLGVILYELITGEKPFGGQNITTVIYKIINENPIPPRELDPTLHLGLSYVIQKALAKNPNERYQTCRELADDLRNYRFLGNAQAPSDTVAIRVPPIHGMETETVVNTRKPVPAPPKFQVPPPPRIVRQTPEPVFAPAPKLQPTLQPMLESRPTQIAIPRVTPQLAVLPKPFEVPPPVAIPPVLATPVQPIEKPILAPPVAPAPAVHSVAPPVISAPKPAKSSGAVWAIVVFIIAAGLGGGGYYAYKVTHTAHVVVNPPATGPGAPTASPSGTGTAASSATSATTGTTTNQPATAVSATPVETGTTQPGTSTTTTGTSPGATPTTTSTPTTTTEVTDPVETAAGRISVDSTPSGAQVTLDGKTNPGWVTPCTISDVPDGRHHVSVSLDGYKPVDQTATVRAGRIQPLAVILQPVKSNPPPNTPPTPGVVAGAGSGVLSIKTSPAGATISVDGKVVGQSPVEAPVSAGQHTYRAELPGYVPFEKSVQVDDGMIVERTVTFGAAVEADSGSIEVSTTPPGANVSVDGISRGKSPASVRVKAGVHQLTIEMAGFQPIEQTISVSKNQTVPVDKSLTPR